MFISNPSDSNFLTAKVTEVGGVGIQLFIRLLLFFFFFFAHFHAKSLPLHFAKFLLERHQIGALARAFTCPLSLSLSVWLVHTQSHHGEVVVHKLRTKAVMHVHEKYRSEKKMIGDLASCTA